MSRAKKHKKKCHEPVPRGSTAARDARLSEEQLHDEIARDTTTVFTCSEKIIDDFAYRCRRALEDLETHIQFAHIGRQMWQQRPGQAQVLAEILVAVCAEHRRRREALLALEARFQALAADSCWHEHLDPVEPWQAFVRERLAAEPPE